MQDKIHGETNKSLNNNSYKANKTHKYLVFEELNSESNTEIAVEGKVNGKSIKVIVDTASCKSFISE
ncbi:MAG: hypothetical protein ACRC28_19085, partial [Clostridium sp.]|uniref:hypothetical protein n=1 Tax=Clostridium sp. TaxID=1506 RepID=UPI003F39498F